MGLGLAFKAFFRAFKDPSGANAFVAGDCTESKQLEGAEDLGHLRLLGLLQRSGRLLDFLKEDISGFPDAQVGAAAREVHKECASLLEDIVTIRPVYEQEEGTKIRIPAGYDSAAVKVIGNVKGNPPFDGVLVHPGWKAHKRSLPKAVGEQHSEVLFPAEVEVK